MQNKSPVFLSFIDINLFVKGHEIPRFRYFDTSSTCQLVNSSTKNIICVKLFRIILTSRKKVLSLRHEE